MTSALEAAQREAIVFMDGSSRALLLAQDRGLTPEERIEHATRAVMAWGYACKAWATLEPLMPRSVEAGYARNAEIAEWREQNPKTPSAGERP